MEGQPAKARATLAQADEILRIAEETVLASGAKGGRKPAQTDKAVRQVARVMLEFDTAREEAIDELLVVTQAMVRYAQVASRALSGLTLCLEQGHRLLIAEQRTARAISGEPPAGGSRRGQAPEERAATGRESGPKPRPPLARDSRTSTGWPTRAASRGIGAARRLETGRLMAIELRLSGSTRPEVEDVLRNTLDLNEPSAIVDEVFGVHPGD